MLFLIFIRFYILRPLYFLLVELKKLDKGGKMNSVNYVRIDCIFSFPV